MSEVNMGENHILERSNLEVLRGRAFAVGHLFTNVSDDAYAVMLLRTGANKAYVTYTLVGTGKAYYGAYGNPVLTADGTEKTIFNRNQCQSSDPTAKMYYTPTYSSLGTLLIPRMLAGSSTPSFKQAADITAPISIIPANTEILFAVQNKAGVAADFNLIVDWYEFPCSEA